MTLHRPTASEVANSLLVERGLEVVSIKTLQSLWAGYGTISQVLAVPTEASSNCSSKGPSRAASTTSSGVSTPLEKDPLSRTRPQAFILKLITPPPAHSSTVDEGRLRKLLSYQVEQYFYSHLATQLPNDLAVATYVGSINNKHEDDTTTTAMLMEDLKEKFPVAGEKRTSLNETQVLAALDWLSGFHGFWWSKVDTFNREDMARPPLEEAGLGRDTGSMQNQNLPTIWLNGGYTYLSTRQTEYRSLADDPSDPWSKPLTHKTPGQQHSISEIVSRILAPSLSGKSSSDEYMTLIHGDVKSENLFTTSSGTAVAFYDFQYTGMGLGVCDLAKFLTCSVPLELILSDSKTPISDTLPLQTGEKALLERYLSRLRESSGRVYEWDVFIRHWEVALVDWLRFQASWGFWGNTPWLEGRVRWILEDRSWREYDHTSGYDQAP